MNHINAECGAREMQCGRGVRNAEKTCRYTGTQIGQKLGGKEGRREEGTSSSTPCLLTSSPAHRLIGSPAFLFAALLEYPTQELAETATQSVEQLAWLNEKVGRTLEPFRDFVQSEPLTRQEEVYTHTFDLQVVCYPYVGYQMFGESYKRGQFLVKIRERYRLFGFDEDGTDLPDHLPTVLRFLSVLQDSAERAILIRECLIPSIRKMIEGFADSENVYADVLRALLLLLEEDVS